MESIINFIMKLWYMLPHVEFIKPIKFKAKDSQSLEWFKDRRTYGFDERELWNLSGNLFRKIRISQNSTSRENLTKAEFIEWLNSPHATNHITWFYMRYLKYLEWKCPLIFSSYGNYQLDDEGKQIVTNRLKLILENIQNSRPISDSDIDFMYEYIFEFRY